MTRLSSRGDDQAEYCESRDWFHDSKRVSFVSMNSAVFRIRFMRVSSAVIYCLAACLTVACATTPEPQEQAGDPAITDATRDPTSEEVMYRVFAAEYLGAEGDLQGAVGEYLEAAMVSDDPEIARRATRVAFAAEAWQEAAMASDRWALLDPQNVSAHESAAAAMLNVGDYVGAEFQMMQILDLMKDSSEAWLLVSGLLARSADPVQAEATLEQIMQRRQNASTADVFYARSQLAVQSRKLQQAFELARQAVEQDPERIEFLTWTARLALNLNLADTALEYVHRAWQLDPDDRDLTLAYADLLARTGNRNEARRVMSEMVQTPDVMLSRIMFEIVIAEQSKAVALYDEFSAMSFDDAQEKAFYQAQAAEALGYDEQSIVLYGQVTTGERALASAIRRAELMAQGGDLEGARAALARLRLEADELAVEESWLAEARILREAGSRDQAFHLLEEAVEQLPDSIAILYTRALLAAELGWIDVAERDLREVIAMEPENAAALNALGYTLADQTERYDEAEALIRQAYILQPNEASIIDSMGWVAFRQGRLQEAEEFLRRAWKIDRNPEIAAHLGEVLWVAGKKEAAVKAWRDAQAIDSQNAVLLETLERLQIVF
jgi:tetratricopeptide (TPR) repeat protein